MPTTNDEAISLFERATYLESQGRMSDAVDVYRKAFKLNNNIDIIYRSTYSNKHLSKDKGKNALVKVDEKEVSKINVDKLIDSFSEVHLQDESEHPDDAPSILLYLPKDIWCHIFEVLIHTSPESWYLRFYTDGTVAKMLSVLPPDRVIPWFSRERQFIPDAEENEATKIYLGRFTISSSDEVRINIENGSTSYLTFHYYFHIKSLGQFKHGKLNWKKYFAVRKATSPDDDRVGEVMEYSIRNEKPFKFSRVKSYSIE
ncbi:hypothetical protein CANMA_000879 [Candida margitis]|uniref:uncharacterized protein n=1 Tax=Candida margitis TaxID=1775924 RepID=UPI002226DADA|nr:uncharacterized protein CANMA_000879 [Candida margitis]KAI5970055.1 hypothetical protein CANMA_000879 [Candida margitis]